MVKVIVGSGGKTTLLKKIAAEYREQGKKVFVTTTTHMYIEDETLLTDDADAIIQELREKGYAMAGVCVGEKIRALSEETYNAVCACADIVLVEADGSKHMPLKYPNDTEPVIPANVDEIIVVCGLHALGQPAKDVCHRLELVKECLKIEDHTIITAAHMQELVIKGYLEPLSKKYPNVKISVKPANDETLYQRVVSVLLQKKIDVSLIDENWFLPQPRLFVCGCGHVGREVAIFATQLGFRVTAFDNRNNLATRECFPEVDQVICDSYENLEKYMEPNAYYVVVTPDHKADLLCVTKILSTKYAYLGMMGSKRKVQATFENLRKENFSEEQIATIFAPIGLSIGAVTPAEIAISILGQIIQEKNKHHVGSSDRELLETQKKGVLCVIIEKNGSAPRGVGSMMLVSEDGVLGTIGGGETEYIAIQQAKEISDVMVREYVLNNKNANGLDMICGGSIKVLLIPI